MANWQALAPLSNTSALDDFKNKKKLPQGYLDFDTALIKQLATQPDTSAAAWIDIAKLYQRASAAVVDPERKAEAVALGVSARKTAEHIKLLDEQQKLEQKRLEEQKLEEQKSGPHTRSRPAQPAPRELKHLEREKSGARG